MVMLVHQDHIHGRSRGDTITESVNSDGGSFRHNDKPLSILQQVGFL